MPFKVHAHVLRHSAGYALANKGTHTRTLQAYLGHLSIQSIVRLHRISAGALQERVAVGAARRLRTRMKSPASRAAASAPPAP